MALNNLQGHWCPFIVVTLLTIYRHPVLGSGYERRSASFSSYNRSKLSEVAICPASNIVCAGVCQTTKGCSSYKLQDQSCVLIDASQLNFSPENEEELQLHVDISFAPIYGNWSPWRSLGSCFNSTGRGLKLQVRTCNNSEPQGMDTECTGPSKRYVNCSIENRPFKVLHFEGNELPKGDWAFEQFCSKSGSFVTSYSTNSSEHEPGSGTILTDIAMVCSDGTDLRIGNRMEDPIPPPQDSCDKGYNAAWINRLNVTEASGSQIFAYATALQLICSSEEWSEINDSNTVRIDPKVCKTGALICGLQTKECGQDEDSSFFCFSNIKIMCCSMLHSN
ncbi:uncharacterized protein LOC131893149 [Tigriopus californicus]|uniref:uncharacterized protein LOC131893149 n=1 Tax=Tigriopus californicus TaxID=6832 RepID=UPI0027DA522F|nr:uncharacterized protein LOC131893149 [Tigriopus californicus]